MLSTRKEGVPIATGMITPSELDRFLETAIVAAKAAGEEILTSLDLPRAVRYKGFRDIVTDADLKAERAIAEVIHARFPEHGLLTEEGSASGANVDSVDQSEYEWFVDPLDGTTNFSHGLPLFCTSLALRGHNETLIGVVFDPVQDRLFTAQAGHGAWLNGTRLQVSKHDQLSDALVALDWAREPGQRKQSVVCVAALAPQVATVRALGSAVLAMCSVAAGWIEAYFNLALYDWDVAAAELLIREAGGRVTGLNGCRWRPGLRGCLASNATLHRQLLTILDGA
jgi:myo-inositol-1(or 4)-monophosphatase